MKKIVFFIFLTVTILLSYPVTGQEQEQETGEAAENIEEVIEYHYNGNKKIEGQLQDGQRHGLWTEWYEEGQKKGEQEYDEGKKSGLWKEWHLNGNMKSQVEYQDDQYHGTWSEWYLSGQKKITKHYKEGTPQGRWTEWNEDGNMIRITAFFANGDKKSETTFSYSGEGTVKTYHEWFDNGNKRLEQQMKNNIKHGHYREWFEDGTPSIDTQFKEGKEDGLHRDFHTNGNRRMEIEMRDGKKNGRATYWNEEGVKLWIKIYMDDVYVRSDYVYEQR